LRFALALRVTMSRLHADLLLLIAAVIWGFAFVFQKTAMDVIGPYTFIAARSVVAALALAPFAWWECRDRADAPGQRFYRCAGMAGLAFFLGAAFQQVGLITATVTNTGFLTALYVVIVPFIAWAWMRQPPAMLVWPCAALSFIGIWLLGGGTMAALSRGDLLVAICAVFWAFHVVITGQAGRHARPVLFTCLQFCVVAVFSLIGAFASETPSLAGLQAAWLEIAYVGLLSSALTFTLLSIALRYAPPAEGAIIVSMENLFAALAAALLLGERLGWISWTGAGLILVATLAIQIAPYITKTAQPVPTGTKAETET
jgi:drug/metabolite transporter (DMT)-like permease